MAIPSRQIGGSTRTNLLWEISKQLEQLICIRSGGCGGNTTTTTSSSSTSSTTTTSTTFFTREYCVWSTDYYQDPVETSQYDVATNTLTNIPIYNDLTGIVGIASTSTKFFKIQLPSLLVGEWFINSYPPSLTFSTFYNLQSSGTTLSSVMAARNETTLITTRQYYNNPALGYIVQLGEFDLPSNGGNPAFTVLATITDKLSSIAQSIMYTTDDRIIMTGIRNLNEYWLVQYYNNSALGYIVEMELNLDSIPFNPASINNNYQLITYGHEIYLIRSDINSLFKIGLTYPYTITEVTADLGWGSYRLFESSTGPCNDVSFAPQNPIPPPCGTTIPQLGETFTYFGVTGTVTTLSGGIYNYGFLVPGYYAECTNLWQPPFNWVAISGPATIVLTFDSPINDVAIILSILDFGDNFTITTNTEVPTVTTNLACFAHSSGNQIISDVNIPPITGSGKFTITTTTPYTELTIVATNGGAGGPIGLSCDPNAPTTTSTTSSTTTLAPTGFNTIYTHFEAL